MASPCDSESYMSHNSIPHSKRRRRCDSSESGPDTDIPVDKSRSRKAKRLLEYPMTFHVLPGPKVNAKHTLKSNTASLHQTGRMPAGPQDRSSDWWLETGDIVLGVENLILKVHKSVLAEHSVVFRDMFDISHPGEDVESLPFVQLHDTAADWVETLKWLYAGKPSYDIFNVDFISFSTIKSHLTISNKYEMTALRTMSQQALECLYPASLNLLFSGSSLQQSTIVHNAAEAILLSRTCDVPSVLPAAFYHLSTAKWRYDEDGGRAHASLSPIDIRRLIIGREALLDASIRLATTLSVPFGLLPPNVQEFARGDQDHGPNAPPIIQAFCSPNCAGAVSKEWSSAFFSPEAAYKNISMLKTLKDLAEANSPPELCLNCSVIRSSWLMKQTKLVMLSIPGWFGL